MSCEVIAVDRLTGPKGGTIWVRWLDCGTMMWSRGKEPTSRAVKQCMCCWIRENAKPPEVIAS